MITSINHVTSVELAGELAVRDQLLDSLESRVSALESAVPPPPPPPPPPSRLVLEDFSDSVLHDFNWAKTQSGTVNVVQKKSDAGVQVLSLAPGQGRSGTNAMAMTVQAGMPSFWLQRIKGVSNPTGQDRFFDPDSQHNALELTVKFPDSFRKVSSAAQPPQYPNEDNVHIGTYHALPTSSSPAEDNNWHYYYQLWFRHDLAGSQWMTCRVGIPPLGWGPTHQRGNNVTTPPANFWGQLTRFYFESMPYTAPVEIPYPFTVLVDEIALVTVSDPIWLDVPGQAYKQMASDARIERRWHNKLL